MAIDTNYNFKETKEILNISESELRKLVRLKQIPYFEIGEESSKKKSKRFREKDIINYIKSNFIGEYIDESKEYEYEQNEKEDSL